MDVKVNALQAVRSARARSFRDKGPRSIGMQEKNSSSHGRKGPRPRRAALPLLALPAEALPATIEKENKSKQTQ